MVPEQRVLRIATIGPEQVANVTPSPEEIAAYYKSNQATYGSQGNAQAQPSRRPGPRDRQWHRRPCQVGETLAAAAAPAGSNAAVTSLADQTRQAYSSVAGDKRGGRRLFRPQRGRRGAASVRFRLGCGQVRRRKDAGRQIACRGNAGDHGQADRRQAEECDRGCRRQVQNAVDEGSNFAEAAAAAKLPVTNTPLIFADGSSKADPNYRLPANLAAASKTGFEIAPNDPPEVVSLGGDAGYALVSPGQWFRPPLLRSPAFGANRRRLAERPGFPARSRGRDAIAAKASQGFRLARRAKQAGAHLPPVRPIAARRIQLANAPRARSRRRCGVLFTAHAKARAEWSPVPRPGFYVVKVNKIMPGNAHASASLVGRCRATSAERGKDYARQFVAAVRADAKTKRNEAAIQATKSRLASSGG